MPRVHASVAGDRVYTERAVHVIVSRHTYAARVELLRPRDPRVLEQGVVQAQSGSDRGGTVRAALSGEGRRAGVSDEDAYERALAERYRRQGLSAFEREPADIVLAQTPGD